MLGVPAPKKRLTFLVVQFLGRMTIFTLTFLIHLIGTLAYAVRIAGVRTRRIVVALSLFNLLMLLSRTANSFQAPTTS
jgi:hypothetical protein